MANSCFIDYVQGNHAERAVLDMHGRSLGGGQDIEVELTEVVLTTGRKACHAGTDIFRRPEVKGFMNLLKKRMDNHGYPELMPLVPNDGDEELEI